MGEQEPRPFTVHLDGAPDFPCDPGESVLVALALRTRLGLLRGRLIKVAAGCRSGRCGICRVQILAGTYAVRPATAPGRDPPGSNEPGFALACRLVPESDLHLRPAAPPPPGSGP